MIKRHRTRTVSRKNRFSLRICIAAGIVMAIAVLWTDLFAASDDIPPSPDSDIPERVGEEEDMFRKRQREVAKQERNEALAREKKKTKAPPTISNMFTLTPIAPTDVSDGMGMISRASYLNGPTFGRGGSIAPVEAMPYILTDEHFFFGDVRGFVTNHSRAGGNFGLGYRNLREDYNAWSGASVWYDADQSTSQLFQQIGLSFEGLIRQFEARANVYLPFTSTQQLSNTISNAQIVGNQLIYGRNIVNGTAMRGLDIEFGYSQPIRERHVVRGFVGGYFFEGGPVGNVNGVKVRVEGTLNNTVTAQVLWTHDQLFGDNYMVGVSMQFPFANNHPTAGWRGGTPSPFRYVERQYNVVVDQQRDYSGNQVAIDPTTGKPYVVGQVNVPSGVGHHAVSVGNTPDGTTDNPYGSIAAAQSAGANIILVQSGSVITEAVTLAPGQHLLGEGAYNEALPVTGGGSVQIPNLAQAATQSGSAQTPVFETANGPAITLASNTEVAGFNFSNAGSGILGSGVSNVTLHDLKYLSTGGDAIHMQNSSGNVTLYDIQINAATGNGVVFDGGTANIAYNGLGDSISVQGNAFVLENMTAGTIGVSNLTVKTTGGIGLELLNAATGISVNSLNVSNTTGAAVSISGDTGTIQTVKGVQTNVFNTYNFTGNTVINSPSSTGFSINGTDAIINVNNLSVISTAASPAVSVVNATSAVTLNALTVSTQNATGLYALGVSDVLQVNGGSITTVNAPAINIQNSAINSLFSFVSTNGGSYGINLANTTGYFTIQGKGAYATGGTIQNTQKGVVLNTVGNTTINWLDLVNNGTGLQSTRSSQLSLYDLRINGSSGYAINSLDDSTLTLTNSILSNNGAIGGGTVLVQADGTGTFQSMISSNAISDANGTAIRFQTTPSGTGASLASSVLSNTIYGYHGSSSAVGYNWNGPASVAVANNTIYAYGSSMTAIQIQDPSTTASLAAQVQNNTITFETSAAQGTGLYVTSGTSGVTSTGTSQLSVSQNTIDFLATGGIGTRYALWGTTTEAIISNIITDQAGGATGMLFDNVAANSRVQIDGNTINLLSSDLTLHQGIIFTAVQPTIQFYGTVNNLIYNTTSLQSLFSIPVNSATGGFYINNQFE